MNYFLLKLGEVTMEYLTFVGILLTALHGYLSGKSNKKLAYLVPSLTIISFVTLAIVNDSVAKRPFNFLLVIGAMASVFSGITIGVRESKHSKLKKEMEAMKSRDL